MILIERRESVRNEGRFEMIVKLSRRCWTDPESGEFLEGWLETFVDLVREYYPHASIVYTEYGRCMKVYADFDEDQEAIERHLQELSERALFAWAAVVSAAELDD
jgi:hypothetical protein